LTVFEISDTTVVGLVLPDGIDYESSFGNHNFSFCSIIDSEARRKERTSTIFKISGFFLTTVFRQDAVLSNMTLTGNDHICGIVIRSIAVRRPDSMS